MQIMNLIYYEEKANDMLILLFFPAVCVNITLLPYCVCFQA